MNYKKYLLVEPNFPIPKNSRNHKDFLPIGLLKLASYLKSKGHEVKLIRLEKEFQNDIENFPFNPDRILITSLFTYWAEHVKKAVDFCKDKFPDAKIIVGGVYASLQPGDCKKRTGCDEVFEGVCEEAEKCPPDYSLVNVDYQIIHASRGCIRKCPCCGVYDIEPKFVGKESLKDLNISKRKLIFYDNNLLANPHIENILNELVELKKQRKILNCESQSGFDGRVLQENPKLGDLLKKANFINPKIAWDGSYSDKNNIKKQIDILTESGYKTKEISVFMIYNYNISFEEMEQKRIQCWEWNVQIIDCRYRPLNKYYDRYNPYTKKPQTDKEYYIHDGWSDKLIREFRANIRKQNICVRQEVLYYSATIERKKIPKKEAIKYKSMSFEKAKKFVEDAWNPSVSYYNA